MSVESTVRAVTTYRLTEMKQRGEKIAMLTSYDYSMAKIVDAAGIDVILVGDSAANVMAGYETTVPITLDMMIYHARSVVRAVEPGRLSSSTCRSEPIRATRRWPSTRPSAS